MNSHCNQWHRRYFKVKSLHQFNFFFHFHRKKEIDMRMLKKYLLFVNVFFKLINLFIHCFTFREVFCMCELYDILSEIVKGNVDLNLLHLLIFSLGEMVHSPSLVQNSPATIEMVRPWPNHLDNIRRQTIIIIYNSSWKG